MDGVARLEDGCPQVPGTACYQDNVLFIVMLPGSAATELSPSDLSILTGTWMRREWAASMRASPALGWFFTILINRAPSRNLVIKKWGDH